MVNIIPLLDLLGLFRATLWKSHQDMDDQSQSWRIIPATLLKLARHLIEHSLPLLTLSLCYQDFLPGLPCGAIAGI